MSNHFISLAKICKTIVVFILYFIATQTSFAQVNLSSSNLPIIIINTNGATIVDEPKTMANMSIINNRLGVENKITDPANEYNGKIGIELRGSTSQSFPKKP
ncbi:MAG: hypothetical protein WBO36_11210, partial [Saprospiraceae bacterium]